LSKDVLGTAGGDVAVQQALDAVRIRILDSAGPGRQVQQAGPVERAREVQHPHPAVGADMHRGRVELGVAQPERRGLGFLSACAGDLGQGVKQVVDIARVRPLAARGREGPYGQGSQVV
jgi:hypothetical protein